MKSLCTLLLVAMLGLPAGASARDRHLLWAVQGEHNTVWLLGSVHVLRAGDATLPPAADEAFDDAEQVVMEIDLDGADADPIAMATAMQSQAMLPGGQTLRSVLGPDYAAMNAQARQAGLDLASLDAFQPWLVAMAVLDQELARRGYLPEHGVEQTLARRAARAGKPIEGLETASEQFAMLEEESQTFPDLYRRLTIERNRAWVQQIDRMLESRDDYLVVVGAMHLVGPESVVDLLRRRGHRVTQL